MKQKYFVGIAAFVIIAFLGIAAVSGFGFAKGFWNQNAQNKTQMQEQQKAMHDAIANNDYAAWKSLMDQRIADMQSQITQENFNRLVEKYKQEEAMQSNREAIQTAVENNDYETWKSLTQSQLTRENFDQLVSSYSKMQNSVGVHRMRLGKNPAA